MVVNGCKCCTAPDYRLCRDAALPRLAVKKPNRAERGFEIVKPLKNKSVSDTQQVLDTLFYSHSLPQKTAPEAEQPLSFLSSPLFNPTPTAALSS